MRILPIGTRNFFLDFFALPRTVSMRLLVPVVPAFPGRPEDLHIRNCVAITARSFFIGGHLYDVELEEEVTSI